MPSYTAWCEKTAAKEQISQKKVSGGLTCPPLRAVPKLVSGVTSKFWDEGDE